MPRKKQTGNEQFLTAETFGELLFNIPVSEVLYMIRQQVLRGVVIYRENIHAIPRTELERLQALLQDPNFAGIRSENGGFLFRPIEQVQRNMAHLRRVTA